MRVNKNIKMYFHEVYYFINAIIINMDYNIIIYKV